MGARIVGGYDMKHAGGMTNTDKKRANYQFDQHYAERRTLESLDCRVSLNRSNEILIYPLP